MLVVMIKIQTQYLNIMVVFIMDILNVIKIETQKINQLIKKT